MINFVLKLPTVEVFNIPKISCKSDEAAAVLLVLLETAPALEFLVSVDVVFEAAPALPTLCDTLARIAR